MKYRNGDLARYQIPGRADFPSRQQLGREAAGEVIAAAGAVTKFKPTMQLAKLVGGRVIATTRYEGKVAILRELGAGAVVTADEHEAFKQMSKSNRRRTVDHAIDYGGNPQLPSFIKDVMRLGGTLVVTSEQGQQPPAVPRG